MGFLKKIAERLFPSKEQREQMAIAKQAKKQYGVIEHTKLERDLETMFGGGVPDVSAVAPQVSTEAVTLADLFTVTFVDRERYTVEDLMYKSYVRKHVHEFALVSPELITEIKDGEEVRYVVKYGDQQIEVPEESMVQSGRGVKSITVEDYRQLVEQTFLAERLKSSKENRQLIETFQTLVMQSAEKSPEDRDAIVALLTDMMDKKGIANNFGGPELVKYSKYANIPVSVLALHNVLATIDPIKFTKKGEIDGSWIQKAFRSEAVKNDPKLRTFIEELTGKTVVLNEQGKAKVVALTDEKGSKRRGAFEVLLPVVREVQPKVQRNFDVQNIFTDAEYQANKVELGKQCEGFVAVATQGGVVNEYVSAQLQERAEAFIEEIKAENEKTGRYNFLNVLLNKKQAEVFETAFTGFVADLQGRVTSRANRTVQGSYNKLHDKVKESLDVLGLSPEELSMAMVRDEDFEVRPISVEDQYTKDLAVISRNVTLIQRLQEKQTKLITKKIQLYMIQHPEATPEEIQAAREQIYAEAKAASKKDVDEILAYTEKTLELIEQKEELRAFEVLLGQIKYDGLNTASIIFEEKKQEILDELDAKINGTSKKDKGLNGVIEEQEKLVKSLTAERRGLVVDKAKTVQQQYAEQFERDVLKYLQELNLTTGAPNLPKKELDRIIAKAKSAISASAVLGRNFDMSAENSGIVTEAIAAEYRKQFAVIIGGNARFQNKGKSKEEQDRAAAESIEIAEEVIDAYAGAVEVSLGLTGQPATTPEIAAIDAQIADKDRLIAEATQKAADTQAEITRLEKEAQARIAAEERNLHLVESRIRAIEYTTTIVSLQERVDSFTKMKTELEAMSTEVPEYVTDPETRKIYEDQIAERLAHIQEIDRVLEEAATKKAQLFVSAEAHYDFIMEEMEGGEFDIRFFDNPNRVENDIDSAVVPVYTSLVRIDAINRILNVNADERQALVEGLIEQGVLHEDEISNIFDDETFKQMLVEETETITPLMTEYANMEPAQQLEFQHDYARYTRWATGEYIFIDPEKGDVTDQINDGLTPEDFARAAKTLDGFEFATEIVVETPEVEEEIDTPVVELDDPTHEVDRDVAAFVENYKIQKLLQDIQNNPELVTKAAPGSEIAKLVEQGLFDPTTGGITLTGTDYFAASQNVMFEIAKRAPKTATPERSAFVTEAAGIYVAETEIDEKAKPKVEEDMDFMLDELQKAAKKEADGDSEEEVEEAVQEVKPTEIPYVKPTPKGIETALKDISKALKKLDASIAEKKYKKQQAEYAAMMAEHEAKKKKGTPGVEVPQEEVEEKGDLVAGAQLRQAYLSVVYDELFSRVGGMTPEETKAIFAKLDVELEPAAFDKYKRADGTVDAVALIEGECGVDLNGQTKAITAQVSTVKTGKNINAETGEITNDAGVKVEEKLYERFESGNIEEALDALSGTKSAAKKKYIARNIVIHTLGKGLIERETVAARAAELASILEKAGYTPPYDPQTLKNLTTGKLPSKTEPDKFVDITPIKQPVQAQVAENCKGKGAEAGAGGK